ncbi:MAG TPA: glycosyltransferase [Acidimicrobiales bacterium]|nr:glycosyltransferase [Acidimicrobiales bacterium]
MSGPIDRRGTIALVPPRYGPDVVGGAEAVIAETAHLLAERGWEVEVLTTCARDHFTWANEYPEGTTRDGGITVRRFATQTDTPGLHRKHLGEHLLSGGRLSIAEQQLWMNDSLRVSGLWHHVLDHGASYRAIVLAPYMFWTTFAVGQIRPERTILMPCLHDEPAAYLDIYQPLFSGARGIWFLSDPEAELAARLFRLPPRTAVVGSAIELPDHYDPDGFRGRHGLSGPFVYYAGRREWAKGWVDLLDAFARLHRTRSSPLRLVTSGVGEVELPPGLPADRVLDLGFVSEQERNDAMAAAAAYVQPSALESFSRTVLEAWGAGTPVIANHDSEVVRWHVRRSAAGVTYRSPRELVEALALVGADPEAFGAMAAGGRDYVVEHYDPARIGDRVEQLLDEWTSPPAEGGTP